MQILRILVRSKFLAYSAKKNVPYKHSLHGTEWDGRPVPIKMPACQRKNILSHGRKKIHERGCVGRKKKYKRCTRSCVIFTAICRLCRTLSGHSGPLS